MSDSHDGGPVSSPPWRSRLRAIVVGILAAFALGVSTANLFSAPYGWFDNDFVIDANNIVVGVEPGSLAERAGLKVGDKIDLQSVPFADRSGFGSLWRMYPLGAKAVLPVSRNGIGRRVVLTSQIADVHNLPVVIVKKTAVILFVLLGAALVLLRPGRMTWGFYLYALGNMNVVPFFFSFLPNAWYLILNMALGVLGTAGLVGFLVFALNFPGGAASGWRRVLENAMPILFLALAIRVLVGAADVAIFRARELEATVDDVGGWITIIVYGAGFASLAETYFRAGAYERGRLRWVIIGLVTGFALETLGFSDFWIGLTWGTWLYELPFALQIVIPLSVTYAVLRHRVIDVRFVLRRSLLYGMLGVALIGILAACDWLLSRSAAGSRLTTAVDLAVAVILGIGIALTRRHAIDFFDRMLFRRRYDARVRLDNLIECLRDAQTKAAVGVIATFDAAKALGLSSAALFARLDDGGFLREADWGWPLEDRWHLLPSDRIIGKLVENRRPIDLRDIRGDVVPRSTLERSSTAFGVFDGRKLGAIALYGPHLNGDDLDPDEIEALRGLTLAAGSAYAAATA